MGIVRVRDDSCNNAPRSLQGCATMLLDTLRALIRLTELLWPVIATLCLLRRVSATDSRIVTIVDYTCLSGPFSPRAASRASLDNSSR